MKFHLLHFSFCLGSGKSGCIFPGVCADETRFLTALRDNFVQEAPTPHERHREVASAQLLPSSDAIAAPNARWATRTVAAKCHPKSTPNKPTPNPCTTGLTRNPTPTATP